MRKKSEIIVPVRYVVMTFLTLGLLSLISSTVLLSKHNSNISSHVLSAHIMSLSPYPLNKNIHSFPVFTSSIIQSSVPTPTESIQIVSNEMLNSREYCLAVPIIMYHHIQPLDMAKKLGHDQLTVDSTYFEQQMAYIDTHGYRSLTSEELVRALLHHTVLPAKSVLVTLDDGYDDMYAYAYPILQKYHVIGNFMIPTGLMGVKGYLSWDELKAMSKSPYVRIYNHTWSHADLKNSSRDTIESEMIKSQNQLESNLGIDPDIMAYPYGSFNDEVKQVLKEHGFRAAFSTLSGIEQCQSQIMELRRVHAGNTPIPPLSF